MIAVDTNILVYAHRADSEWHAPAFECIRQLSEGLTHWAIPWPCIHEFLAVVTHPRIYQPSSPLVAAIEQVEAWLESPTLELLGESYNHWDVLKPTLVEGQIAGPMVHDARVATICATHGVRELLTADRDFSRFPKLVCRNPLPNT